MKVRELLKEADELKTVPDDPAATGADSAEPAAEEPPAEDTTEEPPKEEKPKNPTTIDELFEANTDKTKTYQPAQTWDAKKLVTDTVIIAKGKRTKAKAGQYVIRNHNDIKEFRLVSEEDYNDQYAPVRPSAKPDAEGFLLVKENGKIQSFQYEGDDITVKNGKGEDVSVTEGQYVCRYTDEKKSGWALDETEFEKVYKLKH